MIVYQEKQKIFTSEDYIPLDQNYEKIKLDFEEKNFTLEKEDLVCYIPGSMSLTEIDEILEQNSFYFNHQQYGDYNFSRFLGESFNAEFNSQILGLDLFHADNSSSKTGGKVIKNVSGYDLAKIYLGSFNSLALITGAYIRLEKLPQSQAKIKFHKEVDLEELKLILGTNCLSYINKVCSEDFDRSCEAKIKIYNSQKIYNIFFEITVCGEEDLLNLRIKKLKNKIKEYFRKEELLISIEPFSKSLIKKDPLIYLYTNLDSISHLAKIIIEKDLESSFEINLRRSRLQIPYREIFLAELIKLYSEPLFIDIEPSNRKNILLQRKYQRSNLFENQLIRKLKNKLDPNNILNPGILIDEY